MPDTAPCTPCTARVSATGSATPASVGSSGGRHLKRLSLSTSSAFSPCSPGSPASAGSPAGLRTSGGPSTPGGGIAGSERRSGHGVRSLRLSLGSSLSPSSSSSPGAVSPVGEYASSPLASTSACPNPSDEKFSSSPTLLRRSASYKRPTSSAPGTPPLDGARTPRSAGGHARRTSSISYARSSLDGLGALGEEPAPSGRTSLDGLGLEGVATPGGRTSLEGVREEPEQEETSAGEQNPLARSTRSRPTSMIGAPPASAQATLVEQNADLLSFIAMKERKCLDLREELKRHEGELTVLKKKWESIVARSLQQQHAQASHPRNLSMSSISSVSPHNSPTPRPTAVLHPAQASHSLDLSLLSSTFDPSDLENTDGIETPIELPESVKAAGTWLNNTLGRVLDAAVGFPSPGDERLNALESLQEVDEENEEIAEDETRSSRRESQGSSVVTDLSSPVAGTRSTAPSSVASENTVSPQPATSFETPHKPTPLRAKPMPPRSSSPLASRQRLFTPSQSASPSSTPPAANPHANALSHSRSRSTALDALSGGWSSFNKRWTALSESDMVKNSRKATLGLVDTFEQGLAQALGPLEPPRLEPLPPSSPTRRTSGGRRLSGEIPSPFLAATASPPQGQHQQVDSSPTFVSRDSAPPPGIVPGQGLSTMFASWSKATTAPSPASSPNPAQPSQPPATDPASAPSASEPVSTSSLPPPQPQPPSWDWSAFLPTSSSASSDLASQDQGDGSTKVVERRRSSIVREVSAAAEENRQAEKQPAPAAAAEEEEDGDDWGGW
ncbi:hypothetical protein JCM11641_007668 [Rhodosporidiobolus odoratus]